ncbi:MAG TPA: hypothetical protein VIB48_14250 [Acidimicrobiia bacterium]
MSAVALVLAVVAVCGFVAVMLETRSTGPGIEPDSAVYLGVAHNLAHGHGLTVPFTTYTDRYTPAQAIDHYGRFPLQHFPPLYPLALALGGGGSLWIRLLGALLFAVNLVLVGLLALQMSGPLRVAAICAAGVTLVSPGGGLQIPWLALHGSALSEPLFLACALGAFLALVLWLRSPNRRRWFWVAAALAAAATLTRYVGFTVALTAAVVILVWARGAVRVRLRHALVFAATGMGPAALFLAIQRTRGAATRTVRFHPPGDVVGSLRELVTGWLGFQSTPHVFSVIVPTVVVLALAAIGVSVRRRRRTDPGIMVVRVLVVFVPVYVLGVLAARTWFDASTPIDDRLLSPARGALYLLLFGAPAFLLARRARTRAALATASVAFVAVAVAMASTSARSLEHSVVDHHPRATDIAPLRHVLAGVPGGTFIATNSPDRVYVATGRSSIFTPSHRDPVTDDANPRFVDEVHQLGHLLQREHGVLVMSDAPTFLTYRARRDQIQALLPQLRVIAHVGQFWVMEMPPR